MLAVIAVIDIENMGYPFGSEALRERECAGWDMQELIAKADAKPQSPQIA
jgi:hypothetical protein